MRYARRFIRIPQKVVNNYRQNNYTQEKTVGYETYSLCFLLGAGVLFNFSIFLNSDRLLYKL